MKKIILFLSIIMISQQVESRSIDLNGYGLLNYSAYIGGRYIYNNSSDYGKYLTNTETGIITSFKFKLPESFNKWDFGLYSYLYANRRGFQESLIYANAKLSRHFDKFGTISLRAGRVRYKSSLYNEYRNDPYVRPGVIEPQSIYWDSLRQMIFSGDGFSLSYNSPNNKIDISLFITKPLSNRYVTGNLADGVLKDVTKFGILDSNKVDYSGSFGDTLSTSITYKYSINTKFRLAYTNLEMPIGSDLFLYNFGGVYDDGESYILSLEGMYGKFQNSVYSKQYRAMSAIIGKYFSFDKQLVQDSSFLSPGYLLTYVAFDIGDVGRLKYNKLAGLYGPVVANYLYYSPNGKKRYGQSTTTSTISVGFKLYNQDANLMLGAQVGFTKGKLWLPYKYRDDRLDSKYDHSFMVGVNLVYFYD